MIALIDADVYYKDGGLYWKTPKRGRTVGSRVGSVGANGRRHFTYHYKQFDEHRVIWYIFNGPVPEGKELDHINRDPLDNRIENLRAVSRSLNQTNKGKGYSYCNRAKKYRARYHPTVNGKQTTIHLGFFNTPEEAAKATREYKETLYERESE